MWGSNFQFIADSSYCHEFAYKYYKHHQLIMYEVLIGDTIKLPAGNYTAPPFKTGSSLKYDSIQGFTGGSEVYMVYSSNKSYPRYLITYS